jgi:glycosyltransferase involved in cell wall biosynthesis
MKNNDNSVIDRIQVLMLGESLDRSGGIVSVEKSILKHAPPELNIDLLVTLPNGSTTRKILVFTRALGALCWRLLTQKTDLVYIHVAERGSAFRQAMTTAIAVLLGKPVILHSHSADFHTFYANLPQVIRVSLSWIFRKSTRFIVLSHSWKKFYIENLGLAAEQIVVLPNPVTFPTQTLQPVRTGKVSFLFLGKIGERKGAFDLISAFAALPLGHREQAELVIAGDGEGTKARKTIEQLGLTESVTILDWVDERQRDELLARANVFVLPSYNEGLPMAMLEAMGWGLPVITTPVGGIPELISTGENGLLVTPGNIEQLSAAMKSSIESEQLRISLGNAGRESVKPFEVSKYCDRLADIFKKSCNFTSTNQQITIKTEDN